MKLNKFGWALFLFFTSIFIGVVGYMNLEGFDLINALYMTIITLSTVGFTEVKALSEEGRIFTSVYIIFNLGVYAYAVTVITQYLLQGEIKQKFEKLRKEKKIHNMNNHVIVCGFGRNGSKATEELLKNKIQVVVIDAKVDKTDHAESPFRDAVFVTGDATTDEILIQAGIKKAKAIISSLPSDADNVFITLTAKEMHPEIRVISRASDPLSEKKLRRAGADNVVMPDFIGGTHMAGLFLRTESANLLYNPTGGHKRGYHFEEIKFQKLGDQFIGKRISEINTLLEGAMIVGYKRNGNQVVLNPGEDISFNPDDTILMVYGSN